MDDQTEPFWLKLFWLSLHNCVLVLLQKSTMFRWAFHILFSSWVASAIHSPMDDQTEDVSLVAEIENADNNCPAIMAFAKHNCQAATETCTVLPNIYEGKSICKEAKTTADCKDTLFKFDQAQLWYNAKCESAASAVEKLKARTNLDKSTQRKRKLKFKKRKRQVKVKGK